jgi:transposase-like protein
MVMAVVTMTSLTLETVLLSATMTVRKWSGAYKNHSQSKSESISQTLYRPPEEIARLKKLQEDKKKLKDEKKQQKLILKKSRTANTG